MNLQLSHRRTPSVPTPGRPSLPQPVTAVLTDRLDDVTVADTAACPAASRGVPLLLVTVSPPSPASAPGRTVRGRGRCWAGCCRASSGVAPATSRPFAAVPARGGTRLRAATGLPAPAGRHHSPVVVASRSGPSELDACTLIKAAAIRGGPFVHAIAPCPGHRSRRPALPPAPSRPDDAKEVRSS